MSQSKNPVYHNGIHISFESLQALSNTSNKLTKVVTAWCGSRRTELRKLNLGTDEHERSAQSILVQPNARYYGLIMYSTYYGTEIPAGRGIQTVGQSARYNSNSQVH